MGIFLSKGYKLLMEEENFMPVNVEEQINLAVENLQKQDFFNAVKYCKNAIEIDSHNDNSWLLLGYIYEQNNKLDEAIKAYEKVIEITPDSPLIFKQLADIYYLKKNLPQKAIIYYEKLIKYQPEDNDTKGCMGLAYLKVKNYEKGWKYFESRPHKQNAVSERIQKGNKQLESKPLWQGEDLKDKVIYVYSEAGFGDTMMFARYLLLLKNKCKKVLFEPEIDTYQLFKDSNLGIEILEPDNYSTYPDYDIHIPMMSLPYLLKLNTEKEVSAVDKYLKSDLKKVELYREKYFNNNDFKIGIKWQGKEKQATKRKIRLKEFYKLFNLNKTRFYSVQKGDGLEQLENAKEFKIADLGSTFNDFSDTAAAIENLDLVICNDTSVAHLAGALGKTCWVLLPFAQDWRWSDDLKYCMWYKNTKLFHQSEPDNWDEVTDKVLEELKLIL